MFGFDPLQWDQARTEVGNALVAQARLGEPITYSDLVKQISAIRLDLDAEKDRAALGWLLGDISRETHEQGIGMLSALVVYTDNDESMPAYAFFKLAKTLKYCFNDRKVFWAEHFKRVTAHYGESR